MTIGEKIAKQRKELNYTQEQLGEILGVSRQSISKWESDIAYPETDKLIRLGKLFDCSMDYLLNEEITDKTGIQREESVPILEQIHTYIKKQCRERKSEKMLCGMPLYHIGRNAKGFFAIGYKAKGVFAIGLRATGIVSLGLLSFGILSVGVLSLGFIALGAIAFGLLAAGSIALGLFAAGAISIGIVSFGALSIGQFSAGALAIGKYVAVGDQARAMIAIGESEAVGSVYHHLGGLATADISFVKEWLDTSVPTYLSWAKAIFMLYLG